MQTVYNTTNTTATNTTEQESRNRNKTDKTAQPETTAESATATDMYHGYLDDKTTLQAGRIRATLEKPVRLDSNGPVLTWLEHIDSLWRAGGLWGYKHLEVSTDYTSTDTKYIARTEWRISTPQSRAEYDGYYIANKTVVEYVKHLLALSGEDVTAGDPTESETLRYEARLLYLEICKSSAYGEARGLIKECIDKLTAYYTLEGGKSKREIAEAIYNDLRPKLRKIASFGIWSVVGGYLDGFVKQATEDATPAPEDTTIEEAPPATAPQATEEDTTTAPEVATEEATPATPEKSEEEPMHAPQMLKKIIEEQKRLAAEGTNTIPLKTAVGMTTEVLTPKRAKELLGDNFDDFKTYVLVDGSEVVRFDRPELSNVLYIDDESKEYKEYQRGNISAVELWRKDAMQLNDPARDLDTIKHSPTHLKVIDVKGDVLVFCEYGGHHGYRIATPDEVEIYKAAAAAASEAFTKRLDSYLKRYGKKIYVHSYWADR